MITIKFDESYLTKVDISAFNAGIARKEVHYIWLDGKKTDVVSFLDALANEYSIYQYNAYEKDRKVVQPKQTLLLGAEQCDLFYWDNADVCKDGYLYCSLSFYNGFDKDIYDDIVRKLAVFAGDFSARVQYNAKYDNFLLEMATDKFIYAHNGQWMKLNGSTGKFMHSGYIDTERRYMFKKKGARKYVNIISAKNLYKYMVLTSEVA